MKSHDIRQAFVDFFKSKQHRHIASSPLVPPDDPTLLFTTAGMVQFKPMYSGAVELPYRRACTVQKCMRAGGKGSDLENVGRTLRHHTFFEMLGNFSFGDYFKHEALHWAWEFSTGIIGLDRSRLYASVYQDDDEAWEIWTKQIGLPEDHMVRLGAKDNFWGPAGETGACGPCSEIYYDRGEKYGPGLTFQYATAQDDDPETRYIEFWNCVFPQFDQQKDGTRLPLKNRGVDTGMGLERLVCIVQDAASPYETDLFLPILSAVCLATGVQSYTESPLEVRQCINVIADHVRALTFVLSEGILPSNEGRGYVMRRLLRRASRYARKLGMDKPFLYRIVDPVIEVMSSTYPALLETPDIIKKVIQLEETAYAQTLGSGLERLENLLAITGGAKLSGADVFQLGATYGLPLDEVREIASDRNIEIDMDEYAEFAKRHREESRKGARGARFEGIYDHLKEIFQQHGKTDFLGYAPCSNLQPNATEYPVANASGLHLLAIFAEPGANGSTALESGSWEKVSRAREGESIAVVLDKTPFYAEAGGQVSDIGILKTSGATLQVNNVQKTAEEIYVHYCVVLDGNLHQGDETVASIDMKRRWAVMRNHTATHLLQGALKTVVGKHVTQQGSYVGPDYLRFDFTNPESVSADHLAEIERLVNEQIMRNVLLDTKLLSLEDARKTGAIAPFGEKYGGNVRVVTIPDWDVEFCGGTHMPDTGGIGAFLILNESAIASGVRRIEAATGAGALKVVQEERMTLKHLSEELAVSRERIPERVNGLLDEIKALRKQVASLETRNSAGEAGDIISRAVTIDGILLASHQAEGLGGQQLRQLFDALKTHKPTGLIAVLASVADGKVSLVAGATADAVAAGFSAGDLIRQLAPMVGGSGGGKKEMAQAGGKDGSRIPDALAAAEELVRSMLSTAK
jgi:alanyl-tRNA synthetase